MIIEEKNISDLNPYEKNAKTHPQKQVDLLAKNIEKFGFTTPVLIDDNDSVIAGHGRLLAMKQLGRETVPCVRISGLSDDEAKSAMPNRQKSRIMVIEGKNRYVLNASEV
jgi:ParB-like chromosome segregation protein Spo0J